MSVTVYVTNRCQKCKRTKEIFDSKGLDYDVVNIENDDEARDYVTLELGAICAPVVVVKDDGGNVIDHWSDFRAEKAMKLAKTAAAQSAQERATA